MRTWIAVIPLVSAALPAAGQDYAGPPGLSSYYPPPAPANDGPTTNSYPAERLWVRGQYVLWAATTQDGLEKAEESTASRLFEGVLALTGAGRDDIEEAAARGRYGVRLAAGLWADPDATLGLEASVMYLDRRPLTAPPVTSGDLAGLGALTAGVILPGLAGEGGGTVVVPLGAGGLSAGSLRFELGDQSVLDLQALGRVLLCTTESTRTDALIGVRYLTFEEALGVTAQMTALAPPLLVGSTVTAGTAIDSRAEYCGVLIGADWSSVCGCWEVGVRPTVTVARVENRITRQAFARAALPGGGTVDLVPVPLFPGGLGRASSSDWTALPELDVRVAYQVSSNVRVVAGAGLLVIPQVARATGQLDLGLPTQALAPRFGGLPLAGVALTPSPDTMFLGTVSVGVEIRF